MHPISLDVALLKLQLPELILRPGMSVVARVASRGEGTAGAIVLAGVLLKATVPEEVREGDTLRLTVAETSPERIVLKLDSTIQDPSAVMAAPAPPPNLRADADGGREESGEDARERSGVSLAYETPALGRLDLRVERGPEGVVATVGVPAGAFALAEARAEKLRTALEAKLGEPAVVRIAPRREPFDAYA